MKKIIAFVTLILLIMPGSFIIPSLFIIGACKLITPADPKVRHFISVFSLAKNPIMENICVSPGRMIIAKTKKQIRKNVTHYKFAHHVSKQKAGRFLFKAKRRLSRKRIQKI